MTKPYRWSRPRGEFVIAGSILGLFGVIVFGPSIGSALAQPKPGDKPVTPAQVSPLFALPAPGDAKSSAGDSKATAKEEPKKIAAEESGSGNGKWVGATPDETAALNAERGKGAGTPALAGLIITSELFTRSTQGQTVALLEAVAKSGSPLASEASVLAHYRTPPPLAKPWEGWAKQSFEDTGHNKNGLIHSFSILGPFQDNGGGLLRREGPEAKGEKYTDAKATYSWGVYEVGWRKTLPETATWIGLPLDLYLSPRQEACTYLASKITFDDAQKDPVTVGVAATGGLRLIWDGTSVGYDEDVHTRAVLDRMAAEITPEAGPHLLALKVCSGSQADDGRVRVRFTDAAGKSVSVHSSGDLAGISDERARAKDSDPVFVSKAPSKPAPALPPGKQQPAKPVGDKLASGKPPVPAAPAPKGAPVSKGEKEKPIASASFKRVKTALEIALETGDGASREQALGAAVLRSFAGADDARSPRAPGLLDRVARDPEVHPDELAVAGWVTTFGANQSGWMNQARERAKASNDRATEAFAQRKIADEQYRTGRYDWAQATMQGEPLASATDVEAQVMHIELKASSGGTAADMQALDDLLALDKKEHQKLPIATLWDALRYAGKKPEIELDLRRRLEVATSSGRSAGFVSYAEIEGADELEKVAARSITQQSNAGGLIQLGNTLLGVGRHQWAREIFFTATQLSPNSPEAFEGLASAREPVAHDEAVENKVPSEDPALAIAAEKRALALRPTDTRQKDEIAFRTATGDDATKPDKVVQQDDEKYLVPSATILERAKKDPAKVGEVFERQLHFMRVVTYHDDKRVSQLVHYAREVVVEPRTDDDLFEKQIPSDGDESELIFAKLHRKDGSEVAPDEQSSNGGVYVKWPELKRGDIVEVAVRSWTAGPVGRRGDAPFHFVDYVGSTETKPVLFNEVIVDSPVGSSLGVDVVNGKAERTEESTEGGRKIVKMVWEHPVNIPEEPLAPKMTEVVPIVVGSTYRSWDEFREWYRTAIEGFSEPDDQIKELAKTLTKGKTTREEKLAAIFNFVADDIRYVNYVSAEGWLPNRPQQLLARRQGDCDDKAMLLITLLKAIGVEATPVLVQTRLTAMPSLLSSTKAAIPMFDHGIAFLPGANGKDGTWLDATSPQSRLGPLPSMDARARGLFIYQGDAKIIATPESSPADNGTEITWDVKLTPQGGAEIHAKEKHMGDWAFQLRNNLVEKDARAQWVENYLSYRGITSSELSGEVDYSPDAGTLGYVAKSSGFARKEGDELAIPLSGSFSFTSSYAPLTKRTLPVSLPPNVAPSHQTRTMTLVAPDGFEFAELPPDREEKGGVFGTAKASFKQGTDKRTVVAFTSVIIDKSIISVAEYPAFRTWLQNVDGIMRSEVRLVPSATPKSSIKPVVEAAAVHPKPAAPVGPPPPPAPVMLPAKPKATKPKSP